MTVGDRAVGFVMRTAANLLTAYKPELTAAAHQGALRGLTALCTAISENLPSQSLFERVEEGSIKHVLAGLPASLAPALWAAIDQNFARCLTALDTQAKVRGA